MAKKCDIQFTVERIINYANKELDKYINRVSKKKKINDKDELLYKKEAAKKLLYCFQEFLNRNEVN